MTKIFISLADGIFTDFMNRMRRQREEEMRRRHEARGLNLDYP